MPRIRGTRGDDILEAQTGVDTLVGGAGDDLLISVDLPADQRDQRAVLIGGPGADDFRASIGDVVRIGGTPAYDPASGIGGDYVRSPSGIRTVVGDKSGYIQYLLPFAASNEPEYSLEVTLGGPRSRIRYLGGENDALSPLARRDLIDGLDRLPSVRNPDAIATWRIPGFIDIYGNSPNDDRFVFDLPRGVASYAVAGLGEDLFIGRGGFNIVQSQFDQSAQVDIRRSEDGAMNGVIRGGDGVDRFRGIEEVRTGAGDDVVDGSRGDDRVVVDVGSDLVRGRRGRDEVSYDRASVEDLTADLGRGRATGVSARDGARFEDTLRSIEDLRGSRFDDDRLFGSAEANKLMGMGGDDTLVGRRGRDRLEGNEGDDLLRGGAGRDRLEGGEDRDVLFGGGGVDRFVLERREGRDVIRDFQDGTDLVVIRSGAQSFADLEISQRGGGALVRGDGVSAILRGVDPDALDGGDFVFA